LGRRGARDAEALLKDITAWETVSRTKDFDAGQVGVDAARD
jgi:hypothetical protein